MKHSTLRHGMLAAALVALIAPALPAAAQSDSTNARSKRGKQDKAAPVQESYPAATRKAPEAKPSSRGAPKLNKMIEQFNEGKTEEAKNIANDVLSNDKSNAYERAVAAQIAAQVALEVDDLQAARQHLQTAVDADVLDNNNHFNAMFTIAQLQLQEEQYDAALKTLDRFFSETGTQKPEHLVLKGNALYRAERYPEAIAVLKQAIDASPEPRNDWLQLLMGAYIETNQTAEAAKVAETVATKSPSDKRAQMNLAAVYLQSDMFDKAAVVLEKLRASGQLTEDKDYRQLYSTYLNMEGREKDAAAVINEGLEKGVLKPEYQTYLALAQSYYFSEQIPQAIEAYRKAAPLAQDGETYLNLARVLWQEDRIAEAKDAAKQAMAKGLKKPDDAKKILALPAN